jgi:hypothetical protein
VTSLLRMSEKELAKHVAGQGFLAYGAVGMATLATVLAFLGMASRQALGEPEPVLPGAGSTAGQVGWAVGLGLMMLAAGWLARNVIIKRLQTTIVVSLLLHLLACVVFRQLNVDFPLANVAEAEEGDASSLSDVTLPDYGGMEASDAQAPDWEATTEHAVTDARMEEVQRQVNQVEVSNEQERAEVERQQEIARADEMQRQEVEVKQREMAAELQRQAAEGQAASADAEAAPEVTTQAAADAELQARADTQRAESSVQTSERERTEIETQSDPLVRVQQVESQRAEMTPEQRSFETARREATAAQAVEAAAVSAVEVATADSAEATAREREMEMQRQSQASLSEQQRRRQNSPSTSRSVTVENTAVGNLSAGERSLSNTAPASDGAAAQQRSVSSAAGALSSAEAAARSVEVAAVAGASTPTLDATASSSVTTRGTTGSVPVRAAQTGGGAVSGASTDATVAAIGSGTIGRQTSAGAGQPQLGNAVSSPVANGAGRSEQRQALSGGGNRASEVAVASAGSSRASGNTVLSSGPTSRSVQRSTGGLEGTATSRPGGEAAPSAARSTTVRGGGSGSGSTGRAARGSSEPTARLSRDAGLSANGPSRLPAGRSTSAATLSPGAIRAEEVGALAVAGPQAPARSGGGLSVSQTGGLSGPRTTGIGRRTAGLPGTRRSTGIGRARSSLPMSGGGGSGLSRTRSTGLGRPTLASASEIAGPIKRSTPDPGGVQSGPISAGFSMRRPDFRREAVRKLGGNDASERAVERGLKWLADHQFAAGNWSIHELNCKDHNCLGHGSFQSDTAATGLAMLAFLGAGHSHRSGEYQEVVGRGIKWLVDRQKTNGDLFVDDSEFVWLYSHGMAAIALCEAYGMTKDPALKEPAQKSIDFIVAAQNPTLGGWRYRPQLESDTSVSGWQLMALKSGQMAGLSVPRSAYDGVSRWLDLVENKSSRGRFSYHPSMPESLAMTAEGLLMRQYLGAGKSDPSLMAGASYLKQRLPRMEERDSYYWYYATQVMFHMQGENWSAWNAKIRDLLVDTQQKGAGTAGSWAPETPSKSKWGEAGGRHYLTCLNLLMLEVYYRHLPLYIEVKVED